MQAATRMAGGQWPWRDFGWSYGPGEPLVVMALGKLFGPSLLWWRLLRVAADATAALLVYLLVRDRRPSWALPAWAAAAVTAAQPTSANPTAPRSPSRSGRSWPRPAAARLGGRPGRARRVLAPGRGRDRRWPPRRPSWRPRREEAGRREPRRRASRVPRGRGSAALPRGPRTPRRRLRRTPPRLAPHAAPRRRARRAARSRAAPRGGDLLGRRGRPARPLRAVSRRRRAGTRLGRARRAVDEGRGVVAAAVRLRRRRREGLRHLAAAVRGGGHVSSLRRPARGRAGRARRRARPSTSPRARISSTRRGC